MKNRLRLVALLLSVPIFISLQGCIGPTKPINRIDTIHVSPAGLTVTNTVYVPNTNWTAAIQTGREAGSALPMPIGTIVNMAGGIILAGLAWFAKFKTDKAAAAHALTETLIRGIELAPIEANGLVKKSITTLSEAVGNQDELAAVVRKVTK